MKTFLCWCCSCSLREIWIENTRKKRTQNSNKRWWWWWFRFIHHFCHFFVNLKHNKFSLKWLFFQQYFDLDMLDLFYCLPSEGKFNELCLPILLLFAPLFFPEKLRVFILCSYRDFFTFLCCWRRFPVFSSRPSRFTRILEFLKGEQWWREWGEKGQWTNFHNVDIDRERGHEEKAEKRHSKSLSLSFLLWKTEMRWWENFHKNIDIDKKMIYHGSWK